MSTGALQYVNIACDLLRAVEDGERDLRPEDAQAIRRLLRVLEADLAVERQPEVAAARLYRAVVGKEPEALMVQSVVGSEETLAHVRKGLADIAATHTSPLDMEPEPEPELRTFHRGALRAEIIRKLDRPMTARQLAEQLWPRDYLPDATRRTLNALRVMRKLGIVASEENRKYRHSRYTWHLVDRTRSPSR